MTYIPVVRADSNTTAIVAPVSVVGPRASGWRSLAQIRTEVLRRMGNRADLDPAEVTLHINEAVTDMCSMIDFLFMDGTIAWTTEVGQPLYGLPDEVREVTLLATQGELGWGTDGPLEKIDLDEYRRRADEGTDFDGRPTTYAISPDNTLVLWPKPDAEYAMTLEGKFRPADLSSDTDYPVFTKEWIESLTILSVAKAATALNEFELGAQNYNVFLGLVRSRRNERAERTRGARGGVWIPRSEADLLRSRKGGYR